MDYSTPLFARRLLSSLPRLRGRVGEGAASRSAGSWTRARELALGLVAALVDAFQAFRDDRLQLFDLLFFGVFRIHLSVP